MLVTESIVHTELRIPAGHVTLRGDLVVPESATALIIFAHSMSDGRHNPRNRFLSEELQDRSFATLMVDLLTPEEYAAHDNGRAYRFDVTMLTKRLLSVIDWSRANRPIANLRIGIFAANTAMAAALDAAAERPRIVRAIVSRGGRPDLATRLHDVKAPTLLVVGGNDRAVLWLNERAMTSLNCLHHLDVVPGAGHLFEQPGALEHVAALARTWLTEHLC